LDELIVFIVLLALSGIWSSFQGRGRGDRRPQRRRSPGWPDPLAPGRQDRPVRQPPYAGSPARRTAGNPVPTWPGDARGASEAGRAAERAQTAAGGRPDGFGTEGTRTGGLRSGGFGSEGTPAGGVPTEGIGTEGVRSEGFSSEGIGTEGVRSEGVRSEGVRSEGEAGGRLRTFGRSPAPGGPAVGLPGDQPAPSWLAAQLADREGLTRAVLLAEVLGKPRALRPYGRR